MNSGSKGLSILNVAAGSAKIQLTLKDIGDNFCFGSFWLFEKNINKPIKNHIFVCKKPCNGKEPCIRTCNDPNVDTFQNLKEYLPQNAEFKDHFSKAPRSERECKNGGKRRTLEKNSYTLKNIDGKTILLEQQCTEFTVEEFCFENGEEVEICQIESKKKSRTRCVFTRVS